MQLSYDGKIVACAFYNGNIKFWNVEDMCEEYVFKNSEGVDCISFAQTGKLVVGYTNFPSKDYKENGFFIWNFEGKFEEKRISGFKDNIFSLKISPDSSYIVLIFYHNEGVIINNNIKREKLKIDEGEAKVVCMAYSLDGNYIATGLSTNFISVWTVNKNPKKFSLAGHTSEITALVFQNNSKFLISGSKDTRIKYGI